MADRHLSLAPHLLPWLHGGVEHMLADSDLPPEFSLCHLGLHDSVPPKRMQGARPPVPQRSAAQQSVPQQSVPQQSVPQQSGPRPTRSAPPSSQGYQGSQGPQRAQGQQGPVVTPPAAAAPLPTLPPDHWPRLWQERLAATRSAPVLWTYWALGEDLCLSPNAARRDLLRRLLGDLSHPAGTHCFWPAALPGQNGLEANAPVFWSGVSLLKARALVVMGLPAVKALDLPPRLRPFQQTRHNGRLVVVLRDADFLVQEPQHYDPIREFLRQALAPFARG